MASVSSADAPEVPLILKKKVGDRPAVEGCSAAPSSSPSEGGVVPWP
jgi:hypothetical protein